MPLDDPSTHNMVHETNCAQEEDEPCTNIYKYRDMHRLVLDYANSGTISATTIWVPGEESGIGPGRAFFGALCGHDGRMECHQDFSIEFSNDARYDRHIDACGVVSRLLVLPTRGGGPGP